MILAVLLSAVVAAYAVAMAEGSRSSMLELVGPWRLWVAWDAHRSRPRRQWVRELDPPYRVGTGVGVGPLVIGWSKKMPGELEALGARWVEEGEIEEAEGGATAAGQAVGNLGG